MTSIEFRSFRSNDHVRSFSLEDAFRRYAAWGGIHDFSFDTLYANDTLTVTAASANAWSFVPFDVQVPANFTIKYHKTAFRQGAGFYSASTGFYFIVATDADGCPTIYNSSTQIAQRVPIATPEEADVEVVLRQQVLGNNDAEIWLTLTLYMNGAWVTTYSRKLDDTIGDWQVGLAAWNTDVVTFTHIVIPELCETTEFGTLDPGETAYSGFSRTIEGRYLQFFMRYDNRLRAWRRKQRALALTFGDSISGLQQSTELPELIIYARMMGAYVWSEAVDWDLLKAHGERFREVNNATLLTEEECQTEALNTIKRSEESAFGLAFEAHHVPILEPEDRIAVDGEDWVISDFNLKVSGGLITQVYTCRRYVWGEA